MLFDVSNTAIHTLTEDLFKEKQVCVNILRLDNIHSIVSGNKLFKLHYFLEDALLAKHKTVLTFGGAYSNHLVATAFSCMVLKLKSIGIVRGERPAKLSPTLQQCVNYGMQLKFISREDYRNKEEIYVKFEKEFDGCAIIPEGGYHPLGAKGAALIMGLLPNNSYTHICTAVGTATTLAGLLNHAKKDQIITGIMVLKNMVDINERISYLTGSTEKLKQLKIIDNYHFGGYAKKTDHLVQFMNECWLKHRLPLDFIYTAKMLYSVYDGIKNNHYQRGSNILCIHTGGLQGNCSLPQNTLLY